MKLILAEQLLLLVLDDETGADRSGYGIEPGLAGALLLDLAEQGAIADNHGALVAGPPPAADHPLLTDAHTAIARSVKARDAKGWVNRLPKDLKPLRRRVADSLVERGVLREQQRKLLGFLPQTRYPQADGTYEEDLRARLAAALTSQREPTRPEALLITLLSAYDQIAKMVPKSERKTAKARAQAVAENGIAGQAVKSAVQEIQAAIIAAATVAATAAATSGAAGS